MDINSRVKYRPSFTAKQIDTIIALCGESNAREAFDVLKVLIPFKAKIDCEVKAPAYVSSMSIAGSKKQTVNNNNAYDGVGMAFDAIMEDDSLDKELFTTWRNNGSPTQDENYPKLGLILSYGVRHNLLSEEELQVAAEWGYTTN